MKKYYIFFVLFLLVNAGCDDFLDRMNYTQIDEGEVFKTVENAQGALTGVYDKLSDADFYGRHIQAYEAAKGDAKVGTTGKVSVRLIRIK